VLFYLPITKTWLFDFGINPRLPLFVPGVVELLRDLFDLPISVGTIHNRLQSAADKARD